jgi:hypothetical protein
MIDAKRLTHSPAIRTLKIHFKYRCPLPEIPPVSDSIRRPIGDAARRRTNVQKPHQRPESAMSHLMSKNNPASKGATGTVTAIAARRINPRMYERANGRARSAA